MYVQRSIPNGLKSWTGNSKAPSPSLEIIFSWNWSYCVAANVNFSVVYVVWTDTRPVIKTFCTRLHHNIIQHETRWLHFWMTAKGMCLLFLLILLTDCFWLLDLLLDFTSNKILSPILKDLDSGPPKPSESVPERMDGESYRTLRVWT